MPASLSTFVNIRSVNISRVSRRTDGWMDKRWTHLVRVKRGFQENVTPEVNLEDVFGVTKEPFGRRTCTSCVSLGESHDHFLSRNRKLMHHMCKSAMSHEIETGDRASENEPRTADAR